MRKYKYNVTCKSSCVMIVSNTFANRWRRYLTYLYEIAKFRLAGNGLCTVAQNVHAGCFVSSSDTHIGVNSKVDLRLPSGRR